VADAQMRVGAKHPPYRYKPPAGQGFGPTASVRMPCHPPRRGFEKRTAGQDRPWHARGGWGQPPRKTNGRGLAAGVARDGRNSDMC